MVKSGIGAIGRRRTAIKCGVGAAILAGAIGCPYAVQKSGLAGCSSHPFLVELAKGLLRTVPETDEQNHGPSETSEQLCGTVMQSWKDLEDSRFTPFHDLLCNASYFARLDRRELAALKSPNLKQAPT